MNRQLRITALAAALAASTLVVACGEQEDATVGQRLDSTVTEVQNAGTQMGQDARQAAQDLQAAGSQAADAMARGAADASITAKVNAALAGDPKLSSLKIDVDTLDGRVNLSGFAPDAASRDRATQLTQAVSGVVSVENKLEVR